MRQRGRFKTFKQQLAALLTLSVPLVCPPVANADGLCPKPGDKAIVTHPSSGPVPETRIRCGTPISPDIVDVPPSAWAAPAPTRVPVVRPAVRVERVVVVKRVYIRARPHHRVAHGPFDFLFHH
jgi:hypothetical protein